MPLEVVYKDRALLVIDKPAGLVVHPGAGNARHTLQNALLALDPKLALVPRAGLVHRLDKDTSGLLVIARTPEAHTALTAAMAAREITREYLALCTGVMACRTNILIERCSVLCDEEATAMQKYASTCGTPHEQSN